MTTGAVPSLVLSFPSPLKAVTSAMAYRNAALGIELLEVWFGKRSNIVSERVVEPETLPELGGVMMRFAPKTRNSELSRRLASSWRLRRAAVPAGPGAKARQTKERRPGVGATRRPMTRPDQ